MAAARQTLADFVPTLQPADPTMPLISNAGGELVTSGSHYLQSIVTQVASPVDWEAGMAVMREKGVTAMIEVAPARSEEHTSELQSRGHLVCRLLLEKKKKTR